jgi:hypothetical protein
MLAFLEEGLVDAQTTVTESDWRGGGRGCLPPIAGMGRLREGCCAPGSPTPTSAICRPVQRPVQDPPRTPLYRTSGRHPGPVDDLTEHAAHPEATLHTGSTPSTGIDLEPAAQVR